MYFVFIAFAVTAAVIRYYTGRSIPVAIPLCLAVMFLGTSYYWYRKGSITTKRFNFIAVSFAVFLLPICILAYSLDTGLSERWYAYYFSYIIAMSLFFLLTSKYKIQHPVFVYLGLISYSIYLFHPLLIVLQLPSNTALNVAINLIVNVLVVVGVASMVYFLVESPGQKIGRMLKRYLLENKNRSLAQETS